MRVWGLVWAAGALAACTGPVGLAPAQPSPNPLAPATAAPSQPPQPQPSPSLMGVAAQAWGASVALPGSGEWVGEAPDGLVGAPGQPLRLELKRDDEKLDVPMGAWVNLTPEVVALEGPGRVRLLKPGAGVVGVATQSRGLLRYQLVCRAPDAAFPEWRVERPFLMDMREGMWRIDDPEAWRLQLARWACHGSRLPEAAQAQSLVDATHAALLVLGPEREPWVPLAWAQGEVAAVLKLAQASAPYEKWDGWGGPPVALRVIRVAQSQAPWVMARAEGVQGPIWPTWSLAPAAQFPDPPQFASPPNDGSAWSTCLRANDAARAAWAASASAGVGP